VYPGVGSGASLTMDNLTSTNGLLFIRGINVGATTGTRSNIVVNNAPTTIGGGGAIGTTTQSIVPFAFGFNGTTQSDPDGGGVGTSSLVSYDPVSKNLHILDINTEYATSISGSANAADNVRLTAADAVGSPKTINALVLSSDDGTNLGTGASVTGSQLT